MFEAFSILICIAVFTLAYVLIHLFCSLYNIFFIYFFLPPIDLRKRAGAPWAVVTGSTDGIGKAYAFELAKRGFSLILVSRTQSKLDATRKEILGKIAKVEVETFSFDFSTGLSEDYQPLIEYLKAKKIGVLINNVGGAHPYPEKLHNCELSGGPSKLGEYISINILPTTVLSAAVLKQMVARKTGIIVNIASAASFNPMKKWSIYSASKKYVTWLTAILQSEYSSSSGIIIQSICPFFVATKLSKITESSFFAPDAPEFAKSAVKTIGLAKETTGYFSHQMQCEGMKLLPKFVLSMIIEKITQNLKEAELQKKPYTVNNVLF